MQQIITKSDHILPAKASLLTQLRSKDWLCTKDFLHVESRSLGLCLLAELSRALVLTDIATPHAGRDMGASRSSLSLEHKVDHVTPVECSVPPLRISNECKNTIPPTDVAPSATSNKA